MSIGMILVYQSWRWSDNHFPCLCVFLFCFFLRASWWLSCRPVIYFHIILISTGCLALLDLVAIPGSQYPWFISCKYETVYANCRQTKSTKKLLLLSTKFDLLFLSTTKLLFFFICYHVYPKNIYIYSTANCKYYCAWTACTAIQIQN